MNSREMDDAQRKTSVQVIIRFALYTLILFLMMLGLPKGAENGDIGLFKEGGLIESFQLLLLFFVSVSFFFAAWKNQKQRQIFCVLALLGAFACVRELDSFFDDLLPFFGWQLPASLIAVAAAYCVWLNPRRFIGQALEFVTTRGFGVLWTGFCVATIFAQLVGHGAFLQMLMGDDYIRKYKRVIEELGEIFGYLLLFIGALESVLEAKQTGNRQVKSSDSPVR